VKVSCFIKAYLYECTKRADSTLSSRSVCCRCLTNYTSYAVQKASLNQRSLLSCDVGTADGREMNSSFMRSVQLLSVVQVEVFWVETPWRWRK